MMIPERYLGAVMKLCTEKRGSNSHLNYPGPGRAELTYEMPLSEVIYDYYDRFKSVTQGYGSFDYDIIDYRESNLVLLDILVNGEKVDALSQIVHRDRAKPGGSGRDRLKEEIPRQMFKIAIQGAIGGEIVIPGFDHFALPEGCDRQMLRRRYHRKRKLLEKQKKGKKRMKMIGSVSIPQSAFLSS